MKGPTTRQQHQKETQLVMSPKKTLNLKAFVGHCLRRCRQPPRKFDKKKKKKKKDNNSSQTPNTRTARAMYPTITIDIVDLLRRWLQPDFLDFLGGWLQPDFLGGWLPPPRMSDEKKKKKKKKKKKEKKKRRSKNLKLKLNESESNKTLYICFNEQHLDDRVTYVVRSIKLSDLLSSDSVDHLQLRQVGYMTGLELPGWMGCGVLGTQIVFAGGMIPDPSHDDDLCYYPDRIWYRDAYVFETDPDKQQPPGEIRKMENAQLLQAKEYPVMMEVGGKLYALSFDLVSPPPAFEVFDPETGTWSALPQPRFFQRGCRSPGPLSYAIAGTKMFVSKGDCPVCCFDVVHPDREWRIVHSMCQGGPFPFVNGALVLDLPGYHNKKIMFGYSHSRWYLGVYIMSLDENQESITRIADLKLPKLPEEFDFAEICFILHIGGQKACLVAPQLSLPEETAPEYRREIGTHKTRGVVIPFQFDVDITKIDEDAKSCFTLQFMSTRIFEFYTTPSSDPRPGADGCFVL